jgi:hypothetical protein
MALQECEWIEECADLMLDRSGAGTAMLDGGDQIKVADGELRHEDVL